MLYFPYGIGITLNEIGEMLAYVVSTWRPKTTSLKSRHGPKSRSSLDTQVASIETQLRDMKHTKLHARVADLEEKVFGAARA